MNACFRGALVLLAALSTAAPTTARAADRSGPEFVAPSTKQQLTPAQKAAEARRLAEQASALSQRAARLAAESRGHAPAAKPANVINQATPWTTRGAAEVLISDTDPQPIAAATPATPTNTVPSAVPTVGWRSHRAAPNSAIRFSDPSVPATANTTLKATPIAAAGHAAATQGSDSFELKLTEAALAAQSQPQHVQLPTNTTQTLQVLPASGPVVQAAPVVSAAPVAVSAPVVAMAPVATAPIAATVAPTAVAVAPPAALPVATTVAAEPQALNEISIQLATTKFADARVTTADSEEPLPPGAPMDDKLIANGDVPVGCVDECCPPPRPLFWVSGIEATFLRPDLNEGSAAFAVEEFLTPRFDSFSTATDDIDDFYVAPRLWWGIQGCLWGVNARYWHLRASEGSYDPTLGSDGTWDGPNCGIPEFGYTSCNDFEAYTVDLEVTRRLCLHDCWMQFAFGVRHAEIESNASLFGTALTDDSMMFGFAGAHRQTRGTGIQLGWYGRKPVFPCSCVNWFYNFRWSALWGPTETAAETGVLVAVSDPNATAAAGSVNGASTAVDDNLFIGEIQLGLEWNYALRCMPANAFCRMALEWQRWSGGQGFSAANSFAGYEIDVNGTPTAAGLGDALAFADAPVLDLVGLSVSTGLTW